MTLLNFYLVIPELSVNELIFNLDLDIAVSKTAIVAEWFVNKVADMLKNDWFLKMISTFSSWFIET